MHLSLVPQTMHIEKRKNEQKSFQSECDAHTERHSDGNDDIRNHLTDI